VVCDNDIFPRKIEGNVDKLVANRMKKRGMSWTVKGAQKMARLISLKEMGELHSWITRNNRPRSSTSTEKKISNRKIISRKDTRD